jgi:hypothetical protein
MQAGCGITPVGGILLFHREPWLQLSDYGGKNKFRGEAGEGFPRGFFPRKEPFIFIFRDFMIEKTQQRETQRQHQGGFV